MKIKVDDNEVVLRPLDELAIRLVGDKATPNIYVVTYCCETVTITADYMLAYNEYHRLLRLNKVCALSDRRQGLIASNDGNGNVYDDTGEAYYEGLKFGFSEAEVLALRRKVFEQKRAALRHIQNLSKLKQWLVHHGSTVDSYFFVRGLLKGGVLRGYQVYFNHDAKRTSAVIHSSLDPSSLSFWKVAYIETVRGLKLGDLLP